MATEVNNSAISTKTNDCLSVFPEISSAANEKQMANNMITRTSLITVTPIDTDVKWPLSRVSLMTAMAEEGERAIKMVAVKMLIAILPFVDKLFMNGKISNR